MAGNGPQVLCGSHRFDPFGVWRDPVPKPVVMAVNGIAFTLPIELALAAGIVIAADDVRFRQLEIARGIVPSGGATSRVPAQLGWGHAMRFLLTAEEFGPAEALRIGLVQEVVPTGAHVQRAADLAHLTAQQAPLGVLATMASAPDPAAARTRRATASHRGCRASCAARTPLKGCAASLNGARHVSPATDRFRRAACRAPCGHIRQADAGCWRYPEQDGLGLMSNRRPSAERCK